MNQEINVFESSLPLTVEHIKSSPWDGIAISNQRIYIAQIYESERAGRFHCYVIGETVSKTKWPVSAESVGIQMDSILSDFKLKSSDFSWKEARKESSQKPNEEIVYFLGAGPFIKIGKATGSAENRVAQLQTGCPFPITVIKTMPGGYKVERELHKKFKRLHAYGEWFHAAPELCSYIQSLSKEVAA